MKTTNEQIETLPEVKIDCRAKHTAGPWFRMDKRYSNNPELCIEICTFSDDGFPKQHIARVNHCDHNPTQEVADSVAANAALIASAPCLLQALEDCIAVMERDLNGLAVIQPELRNARAAILKAKGEK